MKFIDELKIHNIIDKTEAPDDKKIEDILSKAKELKGLDLEESAALLNISSQEQLQNLFETALKVKNDIYGSRLVLFAPLYVSNYCSNNCLYCGFRAENKAIERKQLSLDEVEEETKDILEQGHKRILLLMGENHKNASIDYFIDTIDIIYSVRDSKGNNIRRINVEIAPLSDVQFKKFSEVKIGTYTVFQETYHFDTYKKVHRSGPKKDYLYRLETMDRALSNGMHDIGIGALFGLYDYKFDTLALIEHARHLDRKFGIGPHTISIPRIKPASNAPASTLTEYQVSDIDFKKLTAVLRLTVPYTGMILSTREPAKLRSELFNLGISQISAGSKASPGGYKQVARNYDDGQFSLNDCRSSGEVISDVISKGFVPSFCTACYRLGRVGEDFMDLAKPGLIKLNCQPNGLLTLMEYLSDYADEKTREEGERLIQKELDEIPSQKRKEKTIEYLEQIKQGKRDLYF